jgi:hypothetical protein
VGTVRDDQLLQLCSSLWPLLLQKEGCWVVYRWSQCRQWSREERPPVFPHAAGESEPQRSRRVV